MFGAILVLEHYVVLPFQIRLVVIVPVK